MTKIIKKNKNFYHFLIKFNFRETKKQCEISFFEFIIY